MSRNLLAGGDAVGSMSCACFAILPGLRSPARWKFGEEEAGAMFRNLLAGGAAGSMSWRDLFLEALNVLRPERHFAQLFNTFAIEFGGCFL